MIDVIVIGAGASGLISSIYAAKNNKKVLLIEKNKDCGKKLLITGNGRCNYYNENQNIKYYHSTDYDFLPFIIKKEYLEQVKSFFEKIGIVPRIKDGYYYPYSNQATSIQTALIKEAKISGVEMILGEEVLKIEKKETFKVYTENDIFESKNIILATGSKAYPKTGSNGFGYDVLKEFGHTIYPVLPALVSLRADTSYLKEWHGIRSDVKLTLFENDKKIGEDVGEMQLTNYGISGICTFNLSGKVSLGLYQHKKEHININFLYPFSLENEEDFIAWMNKRNKKIQKRTVSDLLDGILNYKLVNLILKLSGIKNETCWDELSEKSKKCLGRYLTSFHILIVGTNDFDASQTCTGGVSLKEIKQNMESKIIEGLYVTGELLDIYGDCGGYNLTLAWITGMIAGGSIK